MKSDAKWAAGLFLLAATGGWLVSGGNRTTAQAAATVSGMTVYGQYCKGCHGAKGEKPSGFLTKVKGMSEEQVEATIRKGKGAMPAFGSKLNANQTQAVAEYTRKLAGVGDPAMGQQVYTKYCAGCHGAKGEKPAGWRAKVKTMTEEQVETAIRKGAKGMPAFGTKLNGNQVEAVTGYTMKLAKK